MSQQLFDILFSNESLYRRFIALCDECEIPAKTILLNAGKTSKHFYFIKKGCLRLSLNHDGKDITFQFFFENQGVASIESFVRNTPSIFNIESIEPSIVLKLRKDDLLHLFEDFPELKEAYNHHIIDRLINYTHLFLSRIQDSPNQRYKRLIETHPLLIQRIPQHYIASYLGVTSVSLSRIRNRK